MKVLCDVHLPKKLVSYFNENGITAIHGSTILNGWRTKDNDFCKYADENDFVFITKDEDFRNTHFLQHTPLKLIKINLENISNDKLTSIFRQNLPALVKFFDQRDGYVEITKELISVLIRQQN